MEYIKRNYEKIIMSVVLLGLLGVLVLMWLFIMKDKADMAAKRDSLIHPKVTPLPPLDTSRLDTALTRGKASYDLDFSTTNRLFNPVQWVRNRNGALMPIRNPNQIGLGAAAVVNISPLYFSIGLNSVMTNGLTPRYYFTTTDETAAIPGQRHARPHYASLGETVSDKAVGGKNEGFKVEAVKGPPDDPDELDLRLAETGQLVAVTKDKPFQRVDGYTADLKYDPENLTFKTKRVGDHLVFAGDDYIIIAIDRNEVILSAQSNQKNHTLRYAP